MTRFIRFMIIAGTVFLVGTNIIASAAAVTLKDNTTLSKALEKLRANFIDLPVTDFGPGPINGLYEFVSNDTILYYNPEKNLLFVGDIYSKDGRSLTAARLAVLHGNAVKQLPLEKALKIGNGPKRIIEFTDPECPYCQAYDKYVANRKGDVTRYIFFYPLVNIHPKAAAMAIHILCANNPQKAFADVYERKITSKDLTVCAAGNERLVEHEEIGNRFGVQNTPTLILGDGEIIRGFDQARIARYLTRQ